MLAAVAGVAIVDVSAVEALDSPSDGRLGGDLSLFGMWRRSAIARAWAA